MKLKGVALFPQLLIVGALTNGRNGTDNTTTQSFTTKRVQATDDKNIYVGDLTKDSFNVNASGNRTNSMNTTTTQSPTTKTIQDPDDKFVVDLTRDTFNKSVANGSHFVMFYDPT